MACKPDANHEAVALDFDAPSLMTELKGFLGAIRECIPASYPIAYLDLPIHFNVGDLLINAGTEQFLSDYRLQVDIRLSAKNFERFLDAISPDHTILLHGGGNFGDIWPLHERMRQVVLSRFPSNRIVLLPQTVHFTSTASAERVLRAYRELERCVLFVRDETSRLYLTSRLDGDVRLAPDMAHQLWKCDEGWAERIRGKGELRFIRRDRESTEVLGEGSLDWADIVTPLQKSLAVPAYLLVSYSPFIALHDLGLSAWYQRRDAAIKAARRAFDEFESIVTNRLHAMILGMLLEKNVRMIDNSYGKLASYSEAWFR